ncbi:hypothetical protein NGB36_25815 [Streptomyces sp. RB6PN25]|uniref:Right handed beta helix domain-containing protein n=1 Tax=Streptomyces humicola TaxID=2953240 RepID=A0ABT1Q1V4_9ACTN|nr:hypothetical protein [Streptomyces humicola]MCQ4083912.1 hypothetical protein [Streptomyces humicola]
MPRFVKARVYVALGVLGSVLVLGGLPAAAAGPTIWYVSATASPGGDGSRQAPFDGLAAVELASSPGDTIVVLPAPLSVPPLDGGIALKPRQKLIGAGPSVTKKGNGKGPAAPRITNTHALLHLGEGVVLADGAQVSNLVITGTYRSAVFGLEVTGVDVHGNDIVGPNTSCTDQPQSPPLVAPTNTPGVGTLSNPHVLGVAGIVVDDLLAASGTVSINGNFVHDAACGDGIDLHTAGIADIHAVVADNTLTRVSNGGDQTTVGAIGIGTLNKSRLTADLDRNTQTYIGTTGSDSEGIYAFVGETSRMSVAVDHNDFAHGIGNDSANGIEYSVLGRNNEASMTVTDSRFHDVPGDMLEENNLGVNSTMSLTLDHVTVSHTTGAGSTGDLPYNNGDCLLALNGASGTTTRTDITHSRLTDCAHNGLTEFSNVVNGSGPAGELAFTVDGSTLRDNKLYNLRVNNLTGLTRLPGKVQDTDLSHGQNVNTSFDQQPGVTANPALDLGGGTLGSHGRNCLDHAGSQVAVEVTDFDVFAQHDWWGRPGGPGPGQIVTNGGSVSTEPALNRPPRNCR